jgi:hypothetical protein
LCHDRPMGRAEGPPADRLRPATHDHAAGHTTSRGRPALRGHDADHFPDESAFRSPGITGAAPVFATGVRQSPWPAAAQPDQTEDAADDPAPPTPAPQPDQTQAAAQSDTKSAPGADMTIRARADRRAGAHVRSLL